MATHSFIILSYIRLIFSLDLTTFHGILVQHIFGVLQQRDSVWEADRQWVLNEAMDARKLQNGGTFRNCLARKIDDVVIPVFSEIIACMDQNYNLDLINLRGENAPLCQFWLNLFSRPKIMQFNYVEMMTPREKVPGVGGRRSAEDFKCQLPFSWIIKEAIDAQWDNAKSSAGIYTILSSGYLKICYPPYRENFILHQSFCPAFCISAGSYTTGYDRVYMYSVPSPPLHPQYT